MAKLDIINIEESVNPDALDARILEVELTLEAILSKPKLAGVAEKFGEWLAGDEAEYIFRNYHDHASAPRIKHLLKRLSQTDFSKKPLFNASIRLKLIALSLQEKPVIAMVRRVPIKIISITEEQPVIPPVAETVTNSHQIPYHPNQIVLGNFTKDQIAGAKNVSALRGFFQHPVLVIIGLVTAIKQSF